MTEPIDILSLTSTEFAAHAATRSIARAEALTLYRSAFRHGRLATSHFRLGDLPIAGTEQQGTTTKFTQRLPDGLETESVILPQQGRTGRERCTLCVSSQVGCAMGCEFCETAQMGLMRNLTASQIVAQWFAAHHRFHSPISNIVFMGMGEPLDNIDAVIQSIRVLTDRNGAAIAPARISVSTVGHARGIVRLADFVREDGFHQVRLAVSVNAPNDAVRSRIMPINRATPMDALMEALLAWPHAERRRILIEYVLIPDVNADPAHADELCEYLRPLHCTVNVIPYNPRRNSPWPAPSEAVVDAFVDRIARCGQLVRRRRTMGRDIMAACGQLGNEHIRRRNRTVQIIASHLG